RPRDRYRPWSRAPGSMGRGVRPLHGGERQDQVGRDPLNRGHPSGVARGRSLQSPWHMLGCATEVRMARVTGIGGVFFKSTGDHARLAAWYRDNLGMPLEEWGGAILRWPDDRAEDRGVTVWHVAGRDSQWFAPSAASFMINYRVDDLEALLGSL